MDKHWDIIGIGALAVDDLLYLDHFPEINEKMRVRSKKRQGGGLTATALVAASRQGARTAYCARLGDDELSIYSLGELEREGVDTSIVQRCSQARPYHSIILVDVPSASRVILFSTEGVEEPDGSMVTEALISSCRFLFIDYTAYNSGLLAARYAHMHGIPVIADIESIELPDLPIFLDQIDHLIIGIDTGRAITHRQAPIDIVQELSSPQRAACVVTDGVNGCWYSEYAGPIQHFPAYRVVEMDTTGCGDVFHGTYAAALARGESVSRAIQVASASAALKATCCGGREGIPDLACVENFIQEKTV